MLSIFVCADLSYSACGRVKDSAKARSIISSENKIDSAVRCLTRLSSFLSFEHLDGVDSHLSRVYHHICTESTFALISACHHGELKNLENSAKLLVDLAERGFVSIQLLGHHGQSADDERPGDLVKDGAVKRSFIRSTDYNFQPELDPQTQSTDRAFFIIFSYQKFEETKATLLDLANKYKQSAIAISKGNELLILDLSGKRIKSFNRRLMMPTHLRRVWMSICGHQFTRLETGFLTGNPTYLCGPCYDRAGLQSDIPVTLRTRAYISLMV